MASTPGYVFIVRHGNRLDVADKQWTQSSATPYDTPLTYGGWLQARSLGVRIANILAQAEAEHTSSTVDQPYTHARKQRRRFKPIIHSSPFLRCIQTSIGISSGLAQPVANSSSIPAMPGHSSRSYSVPSAMMAPCHLHSSNHRHHEKSSDSHATCPNSSKDKGEKDGNECPFDEEEDARSYFHRRAQPFEKIILRLDSFLGEWLTPDYYEMTTPPPDSATLLANAKAQVLRRENVDHLFTPPPKPAVPTPQLWTSTAKNVPTPLDNMRKLVHALPQSPSGQSSSSLAASLMDEFGYIAPIPHYSISLGSKIPEGYVAHARDACISFDYQWDSSLPPVCSGNGGVLGEEWTSMHKRFREGAQRLLDWYTTTPTAADLVTKSSSSRTASGNNSRNASRRSSMNQTGESGHTSHKTQMNDSRFDSRNASRLGLPVLERNYSHGSLSSEDDSDDVEEEEVVPVLILVSHGAGCNALIGAFTHQPALMDVGIASLTMAVRKPAQPPPAITTPGCESFPEFEFRIGEEATWEPPANCGVPLHQMYEVRLFANTDHLRPLAGASPEPTESGRGRGRATGSMIQPRGLEGTLGLEPRGRVSTISSGTPLVPSLHFAELPSQESKLTSIASSRAPTTTKPSPSSSPLLNPSLSGSSWAKSPMPKTPSQSTTSSPSMSPILSFRTSTTRPSHPLSRSSPMCSRDSSQSGRSKSHHVLEDFEDDDGDDDTVEDDYIEPRGLTSGSQYSHNSSSSSSLQSLGSLDSVHSTKSNVTANSSVPSPWKRLPGAGVGAGATDGPYGAGSGNGTYMTSYDVVRPPNLPEPEDMPRYRGTGSMTFPTTTRSSSSSLSSSPASSPLNASPLQGGRETDRPMTSSRSAPLVIRWTMAGSKHSSPRDESVLTQSLTFPSFTTESTSMATSSGMATDMTTSTTMGPPRLWAPTGGGKDAQGFESSGVGRDGLGRGFGSGYSSGYGFGSLLSSGSCSMEDEEDDLFPDFDHKRKFGVLP